MFEKISLEDFWLAFFMGVFFPTEFLTFLDYVQCSFLFWQDPLQGCTKVWIIGGPATEVTIIGGAQLNLTSNTKISI